MPLNWRHNEHDASQITSLTIVYWSVYSGADQRKHQSSASVAFVGEFTAENVSIWWRHHACSTMQWHWVEPALKYSVQLHWNKYRLFFGLRLAIYIINMPLYLQFSIAYLGNNPESMCSDATYLVCICMEIWWLNKIKKHMRMSEIVSIFRGKVSTKIYFWKLFDD